MMFKLIVYIRGKEITEYFYSKDYDWFFCPKDRLLMIVSKDRKHTEYYPYNSIEKSNRTEG